MLYLDVTGLGGVSASTVAARSHESKTLHDGKAGENCPDEEAKGDGSLSGLAPIVTMASWNTKEGSHSDGAGEPEDGGDDQNTKSDHGVVNAREESSKSEVDEHQD